MNIFICVAAKPEGGGFMCDFPLAMCSVNIKTGKGNILLQMGVKGNLNYVPELLENCTFL